MVVIVEDLFTNLLS